MKPAEEICPLTTCLLMGDPISCLYYLHVASAAAAQAIAPNIEDIPHDYSDDR